MKSRFHACLLILSFFYSFSVSAQWSTGKLSLGRSSMGVTSLANKVMFAGGYYYPSLFDVPTNRVDIYDATTNGWTTATLSSSRHSVAAISAGNLAFFAGGQVGLSVLGSYYLSRVDIYNANTNQWTMTELSQGRAYIATASAAGKVFFIGGYTDSFFASDALDIYDIATNTWSSSVLPFALAGVRAVAIGNKIIVNAVNSGSFIYDVSTNQWTFDGPVTGPGVAILGNKVFFDGDTYDASDKVKIYDAITNQWTVATLTSARKNMAVTSLGNKVFFAGGTGPTGVSNTVDIYDEVTNKWTIAQLSTARSNISTARIGSKLFFAGGYVGSTASNVVDIYDAATGQWSVSQSPQVSGYIISVGLTNKAVFAENGTDKVDIYSTDAALPVRFTSFTGAWSPTTGTLLSWQTAQETNNDHFEIQRSADAKSFESIGRVQGKATTNELSDYGFTDGAMPDSTDYYRLKQVDLDGSFHFSSVIAVSRQENKQPATLSVMPNPTVTTLTVQLSVGNTIRQIDIYDLHGRRLSSQVGAQPTTNVSNLQTGAYVVDVLTTNGQHIRSRFVKH